jgi:hypothetical protein
MQRINHLRNSLLQEHRLFLAYIEEAERVSSAKSSTVANWIKEMVINARIDTKLYPPHSRRAAASTKAVEKGSSIEEDKQHANWSRNTQTFERFYYKPNTKPTLGAQITNSIFSRRILPHWKPERRQPRLF